MSKNYRCQFFTRSEFERALYPLTNKADYQLVSASTGASANILSQYFNPNELRESLLFRAATIMAAWIEADAARGREMLRRFNAFVERALPEADHSIEGQIKRAMEKTELDLAQLKYVVTQMPLRQVAQALVADRSETRRAKAA